MQLLQAQTKYGHISNSSAFTQVRFSSVCLRLNISNGMAGMCLPSWGLSQRLIVSLMAQTGNSYIYTMDTVLQPASTLRNTPIIPAGMMLKSEGVHLRVLQPHCCHVSRHDKVSLVTRSYCCKYIWSSGGANRLQGHLRTPFPSLLHSN